MKERIRYHGPVDSSSSLLLGAAGPPGNRPVKPISRYRAGQYPANVSDERYSFA
jgi:hypothetical protein